MVEENWELSLNRVRQLLDDAKSRAENASARWKSIRTQLECGKVDFLVGLVSARRNSLAQMRGLRAAKMDGSKIDKIALFGVLSFVGAAFISNDGRAIKAGYDSIVKNLQSLGDTDWAVDLNTFMVAPVLMIPFLQPWVIFTSLTDTLGELRKRAERGEALGDLIKIRQSIMEMKSLAFIVRAPSQVV